MEHPRYGVITQIAWVVEDLAATEDLLAQTCGAGSWTRMPDIEFGSACQYRGQPADFAANISLTYLEDLQLELIQPTRGDSIYTEFLQSQGPGMHHLCFEPANYDAVIATARGDGIDIPQSGRIGDSMRFAYLDCLTGRVPFIEIAEIGIGMRAFYEHIKAQAGARL
ncbi:VOC family protein [Mycobacterium timonense]|nr:VOC family protein [Mycobacterium timonense]